MSESKKKCRQYNVDYLKFGFIPSLLDQQLPLCLICSKTLGNDAMKPSKLQDHLKRCHPDYVDKDLKFFQGLKEKLRNRPTLDKMLASTSQKNNDGLRASYNISLLIAKTGKPHTIGEDLIMPAVEEVLKTVLHKPSFDIIKKIPLSNNTVRRRIDEMSSDVESFLCKFLKTTNFSIQLDESTLPGNEALLLAYVRFIMNENMYEELLFARNLVADTKGETIFNVLQDYFLEKEIPLKNIISIATDGAPAMVGRYRGFISFLKKNVPGVLAIHCVIHRQHLVAKNLNSRLHESLQFVIDAVNSIRNNALNTRLFAQLCEENDENFTQLLFHTNVRWLSRGLCLSRFFALFETVLEFLESHDENLKENLVNRKTDIAYLTDLFAKFNGVNLQLQGDNLNLIKTKSIISAFLARIKIMKQNIGRYEFSQFPNLSPEICQEDDVLIYVQHLDSLYSDFETRYEDILTLVIPQWIIDPFGEIEEMDVTLQKELIGVSTNEELKVQFRRGYQQFWLQKDIPATYPNLWIVVRKFLIAFPSSYLVERGFSAVMNLITKKRNKLDIINRGDLRLNLTKLKPNIDSLLSNHQIHPSH
jgi:hypothetical protein